MLSLMSKTLSCSNTPGTSKCCTLDHHKIHNFSHRFLRSRTDKKLFDKPIDPEIESRNRTSRLVSQINRTLINSLAADCPHLSEADADIDPRHEAFWFVGGIEPPERIRKMRQNGWQKDHADDPVNRNFQYTGKPLLTLRHEHPLDEFKQFSSDDVSKVPEYRLEPTTAGYTYEHGPATTIPGKFNSLEREALTLKGLLGIS